MRADWFEYDTMLHASHIGDRVAVVANAYTYGQVRLQLWIDR